MTDGNLTIGVNLNNCTGNWVAFDRFSLLFYGDPDAALREILTAYISEANGLLANADAVLLTPSQKTALEQAVANAEAATSENLSSQVDALSAAIQTARNQITAVKENRALMLAALERFENDYNLADGTDYRRLTMSANAWTDLLAAVNDVSAALDDVSQASSYGSLKDALVAQMDATDASLRLFKSYKSMVAGTQALSIAEGTTYATDSHMDSDATEQTAISALNTAFGTYATAQDESFSVSGFLGDNLDFSAAEGAMLNSDNSNNIHAVAGWEVEYADADTWTVLQTHQSANDKKLYMRKNWGSAATTLRATKFSMLPVGKYRLSLSWNSNMANMTNLSAYTLSGTSTSIGKTTSEAEILTYDFEVTDTPKDFDIILGFRKQNSGDAAAQIVVDDVTIEYRRTAEDLLARDYDPAALWFDATDSKYAAAKEVAVTPTAANQVIKAAAADQFSGVSKNIIVNGTCANLVLTEGNPLDIRESFTATSASYSRSMVNVWGTLILPYALTSDENVQFYALKSANEERMTFEKVAAVAANTPVAFKKLQGDGITLSGNNVNVVATSSSQEDNTTATGWSAEGSYNVQTLTNYSGIYYIASNKFWAADGTITLNPFRAIYRNVQAGVKSFVIFEDMPTGIDGLQGMETDMIYDISGRRVTNIQKKGLYIRDGKKLIVK